MKICVVSLNIVPFFQPKNGSQYGGAEVQAAVLCDGFAAAGAKVTLVVSDLGEASLPVPAWNAFSTHEGIPGLRFFHPRMTGILSALEKADADVYFQHCAGMVTGLAAWFCRRHGRTFVYYAGSDTDFLFREARVGNARDRMLFFWGLKNASGIVAQNQHQAEVCRNRLRREARIIPMAIASGEGTPPEKDGTVVWVGALREVKRPGLFLDLARAHPDRSFVLIGGGVSTEPAFARGIVEEAKKVPNVTVTGRIAREEVEAHLRKAAVLVNTSRVEGFPNAYLEAWKHHTPVVSFVDVDGRLSGDGAGVVCRDTRDMAKRLGALLDDQEARAAMGANARKLVERRFAAPVVAAAHLAFFETLVGEKR